MVTPRIVTGGEKQLSLPTPSSTFASCGSITQTFFPFRVSATASQVSVPRSDPSQVWVEPAAFATVWMVDSQVPVASQTSPNGPFLNSSGPIVTVSFSSVDDPRKLVVVWSVPVIVSVRLPPVLKSSTSVPMPRLDVDFSVAVAFFPSSSGALYVRLAGRDSSRLGSSFLSPLSVAVTGALTRP